MDLLRNPRYAIPLVINLTGSIWFFLLIGQAGESCFAFFCSRRSLRRKDGEKRDMNTYRDDVDNANDICRTLPNSPHHKFSGFPLHSIRRVVGGKKSNQSR